LTGSQIGEVDRIPRIAAGILQDEGKASLVGRDRDGMYGPGKTSTLFRFAVAAIGFDDTRIVVGADANDSAAVAGNRRTAWTNRPVGELHAVVRIVETRFAPAEEVGLPIRVVVDEKERIRTLNAREGLRRRGPGAVEDSDGVERIAN